MFNENAPILIRFCTRFFGRIKINASAKLQWEHWIESHDSCDQQPDVTPGGNQRGRRQEVVGG